MGHQALGAAASWFPTCPPCEEMAHVHGAMFFFAFLAAGPTFATPTEFDYIDPAPKHVVLAVANGRIVAAFKGRLPGNHRAAYWMATAAGGPWRVQRLSAEQQPGMPQLQGRVLACAGGGRIFVGYHDPASDHWIFTEVTSGRPVPAASIPRKHLQRVGPVPRAMACDGRYVWVVDEHAVARLYRTQWQELVLRGLYVGWPLDVVVVSGSPNILGDFNRVLRLTGPAQSWQDLSRWEIVPPRGQTVRKPSYLPSQSAVLDSSGQRMWFAGTRTISRRSNIVVVTAPVGTTRKEQWRTLQRPMPERTNAYAVRLVRMPSGPPKVVALVGGSGQPYYEAKIYRLSLSGISPAGTLGRISRASRPIVTSLAAAADEAGRVYAAVVAGESGHKQLLVLGERALWSGAEISGGQEQGQQGQAQQGQAQQEQSQGGAQQAEAEEGSQAVGGGLPDFRPELTLRTGITRYTPPRLYKGAGGVKIRASIVNRGNIYRGPITVKYSLAGATVILKVLPPEDGSPTLPAGKRLQLPDVVFTAKHRRRGQPVGVRYFWKDTDGNEHQSERPPTLYRQWKLGTSMRRISLEATVPVGKYPVEVTVDPRGEVRELHENDNSASGAFVVCDSMDLARDRKYPAAGRNDIAILGVPFVSSMEETHQPGLPPGPAAVALWVWNPNRTDWFEAVPIRVRLDGRIVWQGRTGVLSKDANVSPRSVPWLQGTSRKVSAQLIPIPLNLTHVRLGRHTLRIEVDPDDTLGDLVRSNNTWTGRILVRQRGGELVISARDRATGRAIPGALVVIFGQARTRPGPLASGKTDSRGQLVFRDMPPGSYPAGAARAVKYARDGTVEYARTRGPAFSLRSGRTTRITINLEKPVDLTIVPVDATSLGPTDYSPGIWLDGERVGFSRGKFRMRDVAPGAHTIEARAFGYKPYSAQVEIHGDANARMTLQIKMQRAPRGKLKVICWDDRDKPVSGAYVDVIRTPLSATSGQDGTALLDNVEAGRSYWVYVRKPGYLVATVKSPPVPAGGTTGVTAILHKVTYHKARLSCKAITWAQMETWEGFSIGSASVPTYKVQAQYGQFYLDLALHYHKPRGGSAADQVYLDELFITFKPGLFWQAGAYFEYDASDIIGGALGKVSKTAEDAWEVFGHLLTVANVPNQIYDLLTGEQGDPHQLQEGKVYGAWETHTGVEYESASFYDLPDFSLDIGGSWGGDYTVVVLRRAVITDGSQTVEISPNWESPGLMYWWLGGKAFTWNKVQVKLYIWVTNSGGQSALLGEHAWNVITWRPAGDKDLRMETWERSWGGELP